MGMKPTINTCDGPIENLIGTAYDVVKNVYDNIPLLESLDETISTGGPAIIAAGELALSSSIVAVNAANESEASAVVATTKADEASTSAINALTSETNAAASELNASNSAAEALANKELSDIKATEAIAAANTAVAAQSTAETSALAAATSEANALSYKNAAALSETNAANSEIEAASSATTATNAATDALNSSVIAVAAKDAALISETNAATSESNAQASESAAAISETNALASEVSAQASKNAAALSETNAALSATNATTKAAEAIAAKDAAVLAQNNAETSALAAASSESNALASKNAAAISESNAATSASNALASKNAAAISEANASTSEVNAEAHKNAAALSETNAALSATNASTKASEALNSSTIAEAAKNAALLSETNAGISENNAQGFATSASLSETNAASSAASALDSKNQAILSAGNAAVAETNALASEANASASENAAAISAGNAAISEAGALASYQAFQGQYYGTSAVEPTTDPLGNPMGEGDLYFDSATKSLKLYNGSNWQLASTTIEGIYVVDEYTNVAGQSTFNITYDVGLIQVLYNGVQLALSDFVATNATSVVLNAPVAEAGDVITLVRWGAVTESSVVKETPDTLSVVKRTATGAGRFANAVNADEAVVLGQIGNAAQRSIGSGLSNISDNSLLNTRLGTTGNLGNAATKTVTANPTDSTVGRLVQVGDFGLGAVGNTNVFSGDIGSILATGLYSGGPATTGGPDSVNLDGAKIFHKKWADPNSATQTVNTYNGSTYERHITGGVLLPWKKIFDTANVLGTVSQSGGVPTGAIIQRGSNSNGKFTRFANGKMITTFSDNSYTSVSCTISTGFGEFRSDFVTVSLPSTFIDKPELAINNLSLRGRAVGVSSVSSCDIYFITEISTTDMERNLQITTFGYWF